MTPQEFKAWFDGFTEALGGVPSEAQWARIKARVAEIDGIAITYPIYVDRYWQQPRYEWNPLVWPNTTIWYSSNSDSRCQVTCVNEDAFDGVVAMGDLGRAEAVTFTAQ